MTFGSNTLFDSQAPTPVIKCEPTKATTACFAPLACRLMCLTEIQFVPSGAPRKTSASSSELEDEFSYLMIIIAALFEYTIYYDN